MSRLSSALRTVTLGWFAELVPTPPQLKALAAAIRSDADPRRSSLPSVFAPRGRRAR